MADIMNKAKQIERRDFIKKSVMAGMGITLGSLIDTGCSPAWMQGSARPAPVAKPLERVRIGFVGVGGLGTAHVENLLKIKGAEIRAVCDIVESKVTRAQAMVVEAGQAKPEGYSRGELDFKRLCQRDDLDLVFTATPWEWHVPVCLEAMKTGKHAATEVPVAITIDDCWQLVETAENTGKYCIMMENCNYDDVEMMILNMVKKGLLGELLHVEGGYLHDLRAVKHDMQGEGVWRRAHAMKRNGDFYPTHGLGPIAQCLDINRGNAFDTLVSFGTKSRGLHNYAVERFGRGQPTGEGEIRPERRGDYDDQHEKRRDGASSHMTPARLGHTAGISWSRGPKESFRNTPPRRSTLKEEAKVTAGKRLMSI